MSTIESSKIAVLGNVDAGKSTLVGVLTTALLDDGRGSARSKVARFKHERVTGRTSSFSFHYLIDDVNNNREVTSLIDLCGHERYFKTTVHGTIGLFPDFGMVIIGSNMGINAMTREYMALLIVNKIPFIVVLTKIDLDRTTVIVETKEKLQKSLKKCIFIEDQGEGPLSDDIVEIINTMNSRSMTCVPVISISSTTGYNINFLRKFLMNLKSINYIATQRPNQITSISVPASHNIQIQDIFYLDTFFNVKGISVVISGTMRKGSFKVGETVHIGPFGTDFYPIVIKSIHNPIREFIPQLNEHCSGSFNIKLVNRKDDFNRKKFRRGLVVVRDVELAKTHLCQKFSASVEIYNRPTTIKNGYKPVVHCNTIRQSAQFILEPDTFLRAGDNELVELNFCEHAEYVLPGMAFMFREGRTHGKGHVIETYHMT
jgi:elongation factor 1-alpha